MSRLVVDASVAIKWYLTENDTDKALALVDERFELVAPQLLWIELGNAIWKNIRMGNADKAVWGRVTSNLPKSITSFVPNEIVLNRAFEIANEAGHPIYDCIYLAAALAEDAAVVTVDKRFLSVFAGSGYSSRVLSLEKALSGTAL